MRTAIASAALALLAFSGAADERLSVRTSPDGSRTTIASSAAPDAATKCVRLTVEQVPPDRWPSPLTIAIVDARSAAATVTFESRHATKPHVLCAPRGSYTLTFSATHHQTVRRDLQIGDVTAEVATVILARYPEINGVVRTAEGSPVVGAFVSDGHKLSTKTDALGAFRFEVAEEWPARIEASFPGLATRQVVLPKVRATTTVPPVILSKGGRIEIDIENAPAEFDVDLTREISYKHVEVVKTLHAVQPHVEFEDLEKGDYGITIRGTGSLQRMSSTMTVPEAASVVRAIRIDPISVDIEVRRGGSPLPKADVTIQSDGNRWSVDLAADGDGRIHAEAWQRGPYLFAVRADESSAPVLLVDRIDGTHEATVVLDLPDRSIAGTVVDADDGSPLSKAEVHVESVNDDQTGGTMSTSSSSGGTFAVRGLRDGQHTIVVEANGYVQSDPVTVKLDQATAHRDLTFRLSHGLSRPVRVLTSRRTPIVNAIVIATVAELATEVAKTDATGLVTLHTKAGTAPAVYVLPADGSFAIARLSSRQPDGEETIVVRDGNASLELHANDLSGKPIPQLRFIMRFDGELIPPDVADILEVRRGIVPDTGPDGIARLDRLPEGFLEMWPVRTREELQQVLASGAIGAPVRVGLKPGINVVTLTFTRKN